MRLMTDVSIPDMTREERIVLTRLAAIQAYLRELNGQSTVPHVYIRQQFIGGNSDLQAIPAGELKKKIAGAA